MSHPPPTVPARDGDGTISRPERLGAWRSGAWLVCVLAAWLVLLSAASAQSTGSSAGGSSWGSSGSSGDSSSSGWSGSSSSSYGGAASSNSYEPPLWGQFLGAAAFLVFLYFLFRGLGRLTAPAKIGVSVVRIAIDARARRFVQESLAKLVAESNTASRTGLAALLSGASRALLASKLAWIYCGTERFDPMPPSHARAVHGRLTLDARSRFQTELVRKIDGETRSADAPALVAREHEGEGAVVVSLVVASYETLRAASPSQVSEIEKLLEQLSELTASELVALELIWSPAAEDDRMSTDELEAHYPELTRLTAVGGRVFCPYCAGPHAAELAKCPHCGAPTASAPAAGPS